MLYWVCWGSCYASQHACRSSWVLTSCRGSTLPLHLTLSSWPWPVVSLLPVGPCPQGPPQQDHNPAWPWLQPAAGGGASAPGAGTLFEDTGMWCMAALVLRYYNGTGSSLMQA